MTSAKSLDMEEVVEYRYIFNVQPNDFILAGRSIQLAKNKPPHFKDRGRDMWWVDFENGAGFLVAKNKTSYSVWRNGSNDANMWT